MYMLAYRSITLSVCHHLAALITCAIFSVLDNTDVCMFCSTSLLLLPSSFLILLILVSSSVDQPPGMSIMMLT